MRRNNNVPASKLKETQKGIKPLDYLDHDHETVKTISFDPLYAKEYGIGYASKGTMRGRVLISISNRILTETIGSLQLEMLASLLDAHKCELVL